MKPPGIGQCAVPLSSWSRSVVVATVVVYRGSTGKQPEGVVAYRAARGAFIAAGGDPDLASVDVPRIIGARPLGLVLASGQQADRAGGAAEGKGTLSATFPTCPEFDMLLPPRPNARKPWTPEETSTLHRLAEARCPPRDIAKQLGRTIASVATQASRIGVRLGRTSLERIAERRAVLQQAKDEAER